MKLNVLNRLQILQVLPKEGSIVMLKVLRDLQSKVGLTSEEAVEFGIKQDGEHINWNAKGNEGKDFEFTVKEEEMIKDALAKLEKEKKLNLAQIDLYEKFMEE